MATRVLVTGAGGFIGHHLVKHPLEKVIIRRHDLSKPQGVRGRNSDNPKIHEVLGWRPEKPLREGLEPTYRWIESELRAAERIPSLPAQGILAE